MPHTSGYPEYRRVCRIAIGHCETPDKSAMQWTGYLEEQPHLLTPAISPLYNYTF